MISSLIPIKLFADSDGDEDNHDSDDNDGFDDGDLDDNKSKQASVDPGHRRLGNV